jgi:NADH-quinone oxidoreductase subunit A
VTNVFWPLVLYFFLVIFLVGLMIMTFLLGERHRERTTDEPYECGVEIAAPARLRFGVQFYLIAVFFVIFDLEALFLFAWAVGLKEAGWTGFVEIFVFVVLLLIALVYLWMVGALEMRRPGHGRARKPHASAPMS